METEQDVSVLLSPVEAQPAGIAIPRALLRPKETARADYLLESNHLFSPFLRVDDIRNGIVVEEILRRHPCIPISNRHPC